MAVEKRKSFGNAGTPSKMAKGNPQKSPGGGGSPFAKSPKGKGGPPQKSPQQKQEKPQPKKEQGSPEKKKFPPPPPVGAKKMEIVKAEGAPAPGQGKKNKKNKKGKGPGGAAAGNGALNKVAEQSKAINRGRQGKKNRYQRMYTKMDAKVRPVGACERALKAEQELGHSGRVFTVKVNDPPITHDVVKSWSAGVETAVFSRPVESRQFFVVFKPTANVKKEVEALKKISFAGGKLQVEEKLEGETHLTTHPEQIDPFSLYVTNIHDSVTKEGLHKLFPKAEQITPPRKHNPKIGSSTKFAFVTFESADDALSAFKASYNAVVSGNSIVMRFRRSSLKEMQKQEVATAATAAKPAAKVETKPEQKKKAEPKVQSPVKGQKGPVKKEPESEEEEEDDDEEEDDEAVELEGEEEEGDDDEQDEDDDEDDDDEEEDDDDDDDDDDDE